MLGNANVFNNQDFPNLFIRLIYLQQAEASQFIRKKFQINMLLLQVFYSFKKTSRISVQTVTS